MNEKIGILTIGHGSKLSNNKAMVEGVAKTISEKHEGVIVKSAFMNMNKPSIKESLEAFEGTGVTKIVAVPVFLATGLHTTKDIPRILKLEEGSNKTFITLNGTEIPIIYGMPIDDGSLIADIIFTRVQEALNGN
ncbi:MAG: sirohydrochlorin nickelochelatase [Methanosarcinaceae archaeon]|jgi:sirohydrochlorin cobaltochelatase|nr:sirohydrochlorin nickelochelatase [Methanosarcinaceae archaeon]NKQ37915.1 sirohydrochlorin nickelochelatase [Methanosarcinales archaeon]